MENFIIISNKKIPKIDYNKLDKNLSKKFNEINSVNLYFNAEDETFYIQIKYLSSKTALINLKNKINILNKKMRFSKMLKEDLNSFNILLMTLPKYKLGLQEKKYNQNDFIISFR